MTDQAHPMEAVTLTCRVCGIDYLTDARDQDATLWHYNDGRHRVIPANGGGLELDPLRSARVEALAVAVRLADVMDDLERVVGLLTEAEDRRG